MYTIPEHKNTEHFGVLKTFKNLTMGTKKLKPLPVVETELQTQSESDFSKKDPEPESSKGKFQTPCSKEELDMYQDLLKEKLVSATFELDRLKNPQRALINTNGTSGTHREAGDSADQIVHELNPLFVKEKILSTSKFINAIKAAQKRIKDGTFGICFYTGEPIPKERLILEPHTRWKSAEIKEKAQREKKPK